MATTTPNFGWDVPQSTDLVKDGATAIAALGNDIDTSLVDLKGGTTGQVLSKASNTDMDFTWSSVDPLTILDAKGDLISATAADTPARLAVGADGTYLQADSTTSTGLKWGSVSAGGMTLISSTTISNSSFVTLSSIPTTYNQLFVVFRNFKPATDGQSIKVRFNADSSGKYRTFQNFSTGSAGISATELGFSASQDNAVAEGSIVFSLYDYSTTTTIKTGTYYGVTNDSTTSTTYNVEFGSFLYNSTSAITSMGFFCLAGNITSGTILLYGVK